jgi:hypothetical protein
MYKKKTFYFSSLLGGFCPVPFFEKLNWLKIEKIELRRYHTYILILKCLRNEDLSYLIDKVCPVSENKPYQQRSAVNGKLNVPKPQIEIFAILVQFYGSVLCYLFQISSFPEYQNIKSTSLSHVCNSINHHNIPVILLKVALNTITHEFYHLITLYL